MNKIAGKFLVAGLINTAAGFVITSVLFRVYYEALNAYLLTFLANVFSITFAFITHKYYVFESRGGWVSEYLRSYLTYGSSMAISLLFFPSLIEFTHSIELSYLVTTAITTGVSYIGHKYITFKAKK